MAQLSFIRRLDEWRHQRRAVKAMRRVLRRRRWWDLIPLLLTATLPDAVAQSATGSGLNGGRKINVSVRALILAVRMCRLMSALWLRLEAPFPRIQSARVQVFRWLAAAHHPGLGLRPGHLDLHPERHTA